MDILATFWPRTQPHDAGRVNAPEHPVGRQASDSTVAVGERVNADELTVHPAGELSLLVHTGRRADLNEPSTQLGLECCEVGGNVLGRGPKHAREWWRDVTDEHERIAEERLAAKDPSNMT